MPRKERQGNKSNNALSLGRMIENTKENIKEAEISMEFAADSEELENLEEKNEHRKTSIAQMEKQIREKNHAAQRENEFK